MARHRFTDRHLEAQKAGFFLDRDRLGDHPYCLWFNHRTGSKEIWIKNLSEEFEQALEELQQIKKEP